MQKENESIPADESTGPWIKVAVIITIVVAFGWSLLQMAGML